MMVRTVITWSNVVFPRHFSTMKTAGKYTSSTFKQTRTLFSAFRLITSRIPPNNHHKPSRSKSGVYTPPSLLVSSAPPYTETLWVGSLCTTKQIKLTVSSFRIRSRLQNSLFQAFR